MKLAIPIAMLGVSITVAFSQGPADLLTQYRKDLEAHRNSSIAHFRIGEILSQQGNYQAAANELREALSGDLTVKIVFNLRRTSGQTGCDESILKHSPQRSPLVVR